LLFTSLIINYLILRKFYKNEILDRKWIQWMHYFLLFFVIYVFLLPLGGYRVYRENVIRYDTFLPITVAAIFTYALTSVVILHSMKKNKTLYLGFLVLIFFVFNFADSPKFNENKLEKRALNELKNGKNSPVILKTDVALFSWWKYAKPEESELNAQLIYFWKITPTKTRYSNSGN
jgi:hypothetical protein